MMKSKKIPLAAKIASALLFVGGLTLFLAPIGSYLPSLTPFIGIMMMFFSYVLIDVVRAKNEEHQWNGGGSNSSHTGRHGGGGSFGSSSTGGSTMADSPHDGPGGTM